VAAKCNAKQTQPSFPTQVPTVGNFTPPTIGDWSSIVQSILQLQWALIPVVNPPPANNTLPETSTTPGLGSGAGGGGGGGGSDGTGNKDPKNTTPKKKKPGNKVKWKQIDKRTQLVKIVNPDDDTQFVIVRRTISQTFENPSTGETLTINPDK
jgi:hypothetical protein